MNLLLTNLALRLGSPTGHAILIALALLFIAPMARAMEILVMDDPQCTFCVAFKQSVGKTYADSSYAGWADLVYVNYAVDQNPTRDQWPDWFKKAVDEGRIGDVKRFPTFIIYDTLPGGTQPQEIVRIVGFGGSEWFYDRLQFTRETYEAWKASQLY